MIGLDTNVPLRNLVQDDPVQSPRATEIITSQLTEEESGFISLVTILEVVLLRSLYKRSRPEIANDIEMVLAADTLEVQNEQQVYHTVVALRNGKGTFEDALIGALGIWTGCTANLTFDEKAAQRLHGSHWHDGPFSLRKLATSAFLDTNQDRIKITAPNLNAFSRLSRSRQ